MIQTRSVCIESCEPRWFTSAKAKQLYRALSYGLTSFCHKVCLCQDVGRRLPFVSPCSLFTSSFNQKSFGMKIGTQADIALKMVLNEDAKL